MFAFSKRFIFDLGFNEIPCTLAPNSLSKIDSQLLKSGVPSDELYFSKIFLIGFYQN